MDILSNMQPPDIMFWRWRWGYEKVQALDQEAKDMLPTIIPPNQIPKDRIKNAMFYATMTFFATAGIVVVGLFYAFIPSSTIQNLIEISSPCGNSSAEARALGCTFDQLMMAWFPPHCPHYTNERFINAEPDNPWKYYINPKTKQVATAEDWERSLNNEVHLYGERREHLAHCVFMFLGVAQIRETSGRYTQKQVDYEHLEHCADILLEALKLDSTRYMVETKVPWPTFETC